MFGDSDAHRGCSLLLFSSAVRFGRIPKREKQRLLDEMQSYMNSLNESASMDMEVSSPPEAPCSPQKQSNEGSGSILHSYHSNLINSDKKPIKMAAGNNNFAFHSSSMQGAALSHTARQGQHTNQGDLTSSYHVPSNCPVAPTNNENSTNTNVNISKYHISNQNQCPITGSRSSQSYAANQNSFHADESQNQNSCPWKLNGGAKVLVSFLIFSVCVCFSQLNVNKKSRIHHILSSLCLRQACPLNSCPVAPASQSSQQVWESFSQCFTPAVKEVVEFAKSIPGFQTLSQHDQVMLLKSGTFQVHPVKESCLCLFNIPLNYFLTLTWSDSVYRF